MGFIGLIRLLALGLVIWLLWRFLRRLQLPSGGSTPQQGPANKMVQCRHCGVHLPQADAIGEPEAWYCSEEHRLADQ